MRYEVNYDTTNSARGITSTFNNAQNLFRYLFDWYSTSQVAIMIPAHTLAKHQPQQQPRDDEIQLCKQRRMKRQQSIITQSTMNADKSGMDVTPRLCAPAHSLPQLTAKEYWPSQHKATPCTLNSSNVP